MIHKPDIIGETGLQFFGKMIASISHEIQNVLAVINESAGLLEDFTIMSDKGAPIDQDRLKTLARTIKKQVQRTDGISKNMNKFAHSVDEFEKQVDLGELITLMITLSRRFADMRGVGLEFTLKEEKIMITTNPFILENLLWFCLDFAMEAVGPGKTVGIMADGYDKGVRIRFTELKGLSERHLSTFPLEGAKVLLRALDAKYAADANAGEIIITLPEQRDP